MSAQDLKKEGKEIAKAARKALNSGLNHTEALQKLSADFSNRDAIFKSLKSYPTAEKRQKYKIWNFLLFLLLMIELGVMLFSSIKANTNLAMIPFYFLGVFFYHAYFFYVLFNWKIGEYFWIVVYNSVLFLFFLGFSIFGEATSQIFLVFSITLLTAACIFLGIWLDIKLSPKVKVEKEIKAFPGEKKKFIKSFFFLNS